MIDFNPDSFSLHDQIYKMANGINSSSIDKGGKFKSNKKRKNKIDNNISNYLIYDYLKRHLKIDFTLVGEGRYENKYAIGIFIDDKLISRSTATFNSKF